MAHTISADLTIETARCLLRYPLEEDIPHIFSATRTSGFNDGMLWEPPVTMDELYPPFRKNWLAWEAGTAFVFTITNPHLKIFVGRIGIRQNAPNHVWSIGFWTHPDHQGKGYMTEAAQALAAFGFNQLSAHRIEASHALWNKSSQRVLDKIGMTFMEYIPQGFQKQGRWIEENKMGITKEDWLMLSQS